MSECCDSSRNNGKKKNRTQPNGSLQVHLSLRNSRYAIYVGLSLQLPMLQSALGWMDEVLSSSEMEITVSFDVCGLCPGSHRQCEHSIFLAPLSFPSLCVIRQSTFL